MYRLTREVPYGTGGGTPLFLDIYQPDQPIARPTPAVIFIHGGGWSAGDKYPSQVSELARAGFFCVSINYRLSGVAPFPAAVEDCKCAVRWLRANAAKYNVDPDRIGAWGGSAGGHLTLMVAASDATAGLEGRGGWEGVSSRVQAACSFFGPSDFVNWAQTSPAFARMDNKFLGGTYARIPEVFARASPVTYVSPDDPPLIIFHGDKDQVVPYEQSVLIDAACRKAGLESTLVMVRGAGHGFVMQPNVPSFTPANPEITRMVTDFFRKHLLK
jgi:acetyl esterase/lipase